MSSSPVGAWFFQSLSVPQGRIQEPAGGLLLPRGGGGELCKKKNTNQSNEVGVSNADSRSTCSSASARGMGSGPLGAPLSGPSYQRKLSKLKHETKDKTLPLCCKLRQWISSVRWGGGVGPLGAPLPGPSGTLPVCPLALGKQHLCCIQRGQWSPMAADCPNLRGRLCAPSVPQGGDRCSCSRRVSSAVEKDSARVDSPPSPSPTRPRQSDCWLRCGGKLTGRAPWGRVWFGRGYWVWSVQVRPRWTKTQVSVSCRNFARHQLHRVCDTSDTQTL